MKVIDVEFYEVERSPRAALPPPSRVAPDKDGAGIISNKIGRMLAATPYGIKKYLEVAGSALV